MQDTHPPFDLSPDGTAFFLDFDGTLAEIVDDPEAVSLSPARISLLAKLSDHVGGALAVISGRSIDQLDRFLEPLRLPLAGVHGREIRDGAGHLRRADMDDAVIGAVADLADRFSAARPGLLVERKPASVAIHYRTAPRFADEAIDFAARHAAERPDLKLLHGKMVVEIAAGHRTKGDAIAEFMREPPFEGRRPVFAGDDVTDEDGFQAVARHGGIAVKIGRGPTAARWRLEDADSLHLWLDRLIDGWSRPSAG